MFNKSYFFYIKHLIFYGMMLALIYCPSMLEDKVYDGGDQFDVASRTAGCVFKVGDEVTSQHGYPYARMMNLIAQCRVLESEFHKCSLDFDRYYSERLHLVKDLLVKVKRISQKLRHERGAFSDFVSTTSTSKKHVSDIKYLCTKGKCKYLDSSHPKVARKNRKAKSVVYTSRVLNDYIERMDMMGHRLELLEDQAHVENEVAKVKSKSEARPLISK